MANASMTIEEAYCACGNILGLIEELEGHGKQLPAQYRDKLHAMAVDVRERLRKEWTGKWITGKMDTMLRDRWAGLRRWDRDDQCNDNLFSALQSAKIELAQYRRQEGPDAGETDEYDTSDKANADLQVYKPDKRGVEGSSATPGVDLSGLSEDELARLEAMSQKAPDTAARKQEEQHEVKKQAGFTYEDVQRARERCLAAVRGQVKSEKYRVIPVDRVLHGEVSAVLATTSSARTKELIWLAFYAGKINGTYGMDEELQEMLGKKG